MNSSNSSEETHKKTKDSFKVGIDYKLNKSLKGIIGKSEKPAYPLYIQVRIKRQNISFRGCLDLHIDEDALNIVLQDPFLSTLFEYEKSSIERSILTYFNENSDFTISKWLNEYYRPNSLRDSVKQNLSQEIYSVYRMLADASNIDTSSLLNLIHVDGEIPALSLSKILYQLGISDVELAMKLSNGYLELQESMNRHINLLIPESYYQTSIGELPIGFLKQVCKLQTTEYPTTLEKRLVSDIQSLINQIPTSSKK